MKQNRPDDPRRYDPDMPPAGPSKVDMDAYFLRPPCTHDGPGNEFYCDQCATGGTSDSGGPTE